MTEPVPYANLSPYAGEISQLQTLSILHYVWGALTMLFSSIFIIHIVLGIWMARGGMNSPNWVNQSTSTVSNPNGNGTFTTSPPVYPNNQPPPAWVGFFFMAFGGCFVIGGWTLGILTIVSGRRLAHHRSRTFSMVIAGINCIWVPFGTLLGVFTIIVLAKDAVKALYFDQSGRSML